MQAAASLLSACASSQQASQEAERKSNGELDTRVQAIAQIIKDRKSASATPSIACDFGGQELQLLNQGSKLRLSIEASLQVFDLVLKNLQPGEMRIVEERLRALKHVKKGEKKYLDLHRFLDYSQNELFRITFEYLHFLDVVSLLRVSKKVFNYVSNEAFWVQLGQRIGFKQFPQVQLINPHCVRHAVSCTGHKYKNGAGQEITHNGYFQAISQMRKNLAPFSNLYKKRFLNRLFALPRITFSREAHEKPFDEKDLATLPARFVFHLHDGRMGIGLKYVNGLKEEDQKEGCEQLELLMQVNGSESNWSIIKKLRPSWTCLNHNQVYVSDSDRDYLARLWNGKPCGSRDLANNDFQKRAETSPKVINGKSVVRLLK